MKFAIISDIHGNYPAFETVLEDANNKGIFNYIIAGDYCLSGPYPDKCIEKLKILENAKIIRGNEEQYLENLIGKDQSKWTDGQMQISYWNYRNIKDENLKYILELPHTIDFNCNGVEVHIAHMREDFPEDSQINDGVYIFGHTHIQGAEKLEDKNVYLINPGSCGLPLDGITHSMPYAILEITDDGKVNFEECRVPFATEEYIEELKKTTQYTEANVWSRVIIKELLSAEEHLMYFLQFVEKFANIINDDKRPYAVETWEKAFDIWDKALSDAVFKGEKE